MTKPFECRNCGEQVWWDVNKQGKRYLAGTALWEGAYGGQKTIKMPHYCPQYAREMYQAGLVKKAEELAQALTNGEVVKGQTVEVFKGRKVAKGTVGVVFWVAPQPDNYGVIKVGFTTAAGEKHFTNIENVKVKPINEEVTQ